MNDQLNLYDELKALQLVVDNNIKEKAQGVGVRRVESTESRMNTFKRWIFNWLE